MKNKFFLLALAIVAVAGASIFSAFKNSPHAAHRADQFWQYNGGDSLQASSYSPTSGIPCEGEENVCMIQAPASANPNQPQLSNALKNRITNHDTSEGDVFLKE